MRVRNLVALVTVVAAAILAACGGGGGGSSAVPGTTSGPTAGGSALVTITIRKPAASASSSSTVRQPKYIPPDTARDRVHAVANDGTAVSDTTQGPFNGYVPGVGYESFPGIAQLFTSGVPSAAAIPLPTLETTATVYDSDC